MPRKRKLVNDAERKLGVVGSTESAKAYDFFSNAMARMGFGTPNLGQGAQYTLERLSYDYWLLITLYRNHWISRRIIDVPAKDMVKAWPRLTSDVTPKDLTKIDRAIRRTNTKNSVLTGLTWARLFGGSGALIVIDGQERELEEPLDLESIEIGGYKGLIPFDRWSGISPDGDICDDINKPLDFGKPEFYNVHVKGGANFRVHCSRMLRFLGPTVPEPENSAQSWWGISVLEPVYESITKLDNMSWNILSLTFRANLLGLKMEDLSQLLSGLGQSQLAAQKFEARMSAMNHMMSNNSLIPLGKDGGLESATYTFGGLAEVFQLFQLDLSGASEIPVARLWGRTYSGLGQTGDGDEKIYEEKISSDQAAFLIPQLEKLMPVICMSELGEVPDDLDFICPSVRVLDEKEKVELAKNVMDTVAVGVNLGIFSQQLGAKEIKQSSDITGVGSNLTDEYIEKLPDTPQQEGELGEGLFGEGGGGLNPADDPNKVIREENKAGEKESKEDTEKLEAKAPAMDALPKDLKPGECVLVHGKLLTVQYVVPDTEDLFGEPTVQVHFTTGEIVPYSAAKDVKTHANDANVYKTSSLRGPSSVSQEGRKRLESPDGKRWAVSAYRKRSLANHTFDIVEVWTLKERHSSGSVVTVDNNVGEEKARAWVGVAKAKDADGPSTKHEGMELYHALPVRVETPSGGVRSGKDWSVRLPADYGFIEGVTGSDGDSLDAYVGPSPESNNVFVIDQRTLDGKSFDEHKCMLGYHTRESAIDDYMAGHHKSDKVFGACTEFTMPMFRRWAATHDMSKPCSDEVRV